MVKRQFCETHVGDIIDVIAAVGDAIKDNDSDNAILGLINKRFNNSSFRGSITSQANKLVMTFPVICTNTISNNTMVMISKAIERKCVVLLQMLFASELLIKSGEGGVKDAISRYYTGIDFKSMTVDDAMRAMDAVISNEVTGSEAHEIGQILKEQAIKAINSKRYDNDIDFVEESTNTNTTRHNSYKDFMNEDVFVEDSNKNEYDDLLRSYPEKVRNMYVDMFNSIDSAISSGTNKKDKNSSKAIQSIEAKSNLINGILRYQLDNNKRLDQLTQRDTEKILRDKQLANDLDKIEIERVASDIKNALNNTQIKKLNQEILFSKNQEDRAALIHSLDMELKSRQLRTAGTDFFHKQILDSDVKKCNELVPSMLVVDFTVNTPDGGHPVTKTGIVGIKARIISVDSYEIMDKINAKDKSKSGFVNLIKATTGETHFLKDFILGIDKAKIDALSRSKKGSTNPIWKVLERRATKQSIRKALGQHNDASPITTLVITQQEVDYMKKMYGIDINNVSVASNIISSYNLMGLVIIDESVEAAKFLWDGELDSFEIMSFTGLEREDAGNNGMYKKVINLLSQSR